MVLRAVFVWRAGVVAGVLAVCGLCAGMGAAPAGAATPEAPLAGAASEVTSSIARLNGELNPGGGVEKVGYYFAYNLGESCAGGTTSTPGEAEGNHVKVSEGITGLEPNERYTFCLLATNESGTTEGSAESLTTEAAMPAVDGESVSGVVPPMRRSKRRLTPTTRKPNIRCSMRPTKRSRVPSPSRAGVCPRASATSPSRLISAAG